MIFTWTIWGMAPLMHSAEMLGGFLFMGISADFVLILIALDIWRSK